MANWIYLEKQYEGYDDINAVALASVLFASSKSYHVVHTNVVSIYLKGLNNVTIGIPSPKDGDSVQRIVLPINAPFEVLCANISKELALPVIKNLQVYTGFVRRENEIDRQLTRKEHIVLFSYYSYERERELLSRLEKVVNQLNNAGISSVCCGSLTEELLENAYDFRELIQVDEIIKNRDRISALVTSLPLVKEIGRLLNIPVVYLYSYAFIVYDKNGEYVASMIHDGEQRLCEAILNVCEGNAPNIFTSKATIVKKFEVPYNFDEEILPYYQKNSNFINFLFLPPYYEDSTNTRTKLQSKVKGRSYMPQTREEYEYHLRLIKSRNLRFVVLLQEREKVVSLELLEYYSNFGAAGFIIANDDNARIIKEFDPQLLVVSSIVQRRLKDISKVSLEYYDYCVMFYPFTRSLNALKQLSSIKDKLVIMPNSFCHTDCPGVQHWFAKDLKHFDVERFCPAYNDVSRSTFIYPEHLKLFDEYVGGYKLQGREWRTDYIVTICESYFNRITLATLISPSLNDEFRKQQSCVPLEKYYNAKTEEIINII